MWCMELKLCTSDKHHRCYKHTKFRQNLRGDPKFLVDLTWNEPKACMEAMQNVLTNIDPALSKSSIRDFHQLGNTIPPIQNPDLYQLNFFALLMQRLSYLKDPQYQNQFQSNLLLPEKKEQSKQSI